MPRTRYSERAGRYELAGNRGRFVSRAQVREVIDRTLDRSALRVRALAEQLRAGQLSVAEWQMAMHQEVKTTHLWNAAAARGGWAQMSPADFGRVGRTVRDHLGYLRGFAAEIEAGLPLDGRFLQRVTLYTKAGRESFERTQRSEMERRGFDEERNERHATDSCDGCLEATAAGWVPVGTLPPPGRRTCRSNCKCRLVFRNSTLEQEAA